MSLGDRTAYADAALRAEVARTLTSVPGGRATTVFRSACALGNLVGAGLLQQLQTVADGADRAYEVMANSRRQQLEHPQFNLYAHEPS